ncbi:MAG: glutamate 5-kinase [Roseofilum sp. SBFL]|uniref:glutamate 5-kinase n=1 Tax=unclassified Roseofilum TaxID=2620099 RepID=UPI001B1E55B6|nr:MULTISPECIES: glutamate 5-kinase [unclassified Roseofilum]MBP0012506.1 glutamate 5-kinase [Roseofilum sp. SID3]MBP0037585.1 glutamate 5-kinase [Roseofilum sp. SID1]MBP0041857.1 glutamate 5-kinase [Roseofilum sp. SBFL]
MSLTLVIKIGTSSLTDPETGNLALSTLALLVEVLSQLRHQGHRVILVSSGAMGVGCSRLGLKKRPRDIALKQAIAAVGQGRLMRIYDDLFTTLDQAIAQVLLTRRDLESRVSYVNAYDAFQELLDLGVIPIVNENDTVATDELRRKFGDNDTLAALVASLVEADWLFLLTDVDKLYSADPHLVPDAQPIAHVHNLEELTEVEAGEASTWGTGGMSTKIAAARIATNAGVRMVIMQGRYPNQIPRILDGDEIGTQFHPAPRTLNARKRWIANGLVPSGTVVLDPGAVKAICDRGKSLLAVGISEVIGQFQVSEAVTLCDLEGKEVARGIVNYGSDELDLIKGYRSDDIPDLLGYEGSDTVVHRDDLVLM